MLAYRLLRWQQPPELVEVPVPAPGPGEVLVEVAGCGLCHSDLTMVAIPGEFGDALGWQVPFTLGHETAGRVALLGEGVVGLIAGDAVALTSPSSCGRCPTCLAGRESACPYGDAGRGYGRDGGLAGYVVAPMREVLPFGALDPRTAGPLTDAGATSHHAVRRARSGARGGLDRRGHRDRRARLVRRPDPEGDHAGPDRGGRHRPGPPGDRHRARGRRRGRRRRRAASSARPSPRSPEMPRAASTR